MHGLLEGKAQAFVLAVVIALLSRGDDGAVWGRRSSTPRSTGKGWVDVVCVHLCVGACTGSTVVLDGDVVEGDVVYGHGISAVAHL